MSGAVSLLHLTSYENGGGSEVRVSRRRPRPGARSPQPSDLAPGRSKKSHRGEISTSPRRGTAGAGTAGANGRAGLAASIRVANVQTAAVYGGEGFQGALAPGAAPAPIAGQCVTFWWACYPHAPALLRRDGFTARWLAVEPRVACHKGVRVVGRFVLSAAMLAAGCAGGCLNSLDPNIRVVASIWVLWGAAVLPARRAGLVGRAPRPPAAAQAA